jgi:hypothetical protein
MLRPQPGSGRSGAVADFTIFDDDDHHVPALSKIA